MKYWLLALLGVFIGLVIFLAVLFDDDSEEALEAVTSSLISTTTTSSSTTTSSAPTTVPPTTTVPTYTGPFYPQLFIDATDELSCSRIGGNWRYGPPSWGQYCALDRFLLAYSDSELCVEYGYVWNDEQQRCERPTSGVEFANELFEIREENACIDAGGVWALMQWGEYRCVEDDGSIRDAYFEDVCLERGGTWGTDELSYKPEYYFCYEDDGSLWDARHQATCIERGGLWDPERTHRHPENEDLWGHCFEDFGGISDAFDEVTCGSRGGIWMVDPNVYETTFNCLTYETEYELEDLFDSNTDWKNVLLRNCEDPDEILDQLSGFMIGEPWLDLFWKAEDLSCRPEPPETDDQYRLLSETFELALVNEGGEETLLYGMTIGWSTLMEVLDIEGPGFKNFAWNLVTSSKGDVLFSGCQPCRSPGLKPFDGLFIMSSDGTNKRRFFGNCYRYCYVEGFSSDGESFLFYEVYNGSISSSLLQLDLEANLIRVIDPVPDSRTIINNVSVSPSGTYIAVWVTTDPVLRSDLFITDFEGSPFRQITNFDPMDMYSFNVFNTADIYWSPDETQIGFCLHITDYDADAYGNGCKQSVAANTSASSTDELEEIPLETYDLWINQQE